MIEDFIKIQYTSEFDLDGYTAVCIVLSKTNKITSPKGLASRSTDKRRLIYLLFFELNCQIKDVLASHANGYKLMCI